MLHNKMCRLCLKPPAVCYSIFENNIASMLESLLNKQVSPYDELSAVICLKCFLNLKLCYNFQQRITKCEEQLLNMNTSYIAVHIKTERDPDEDLVKLCENCVICGLFIEQKSKNDHIRDHFSEPQTCGICNQSFQDIQKLKKHLEEHSEYMVHECNQCPAKFRYKSMYDLHKKTICSAEKVKKRSKRGYMDSKSNRKQVLFGNQELKKEIFKLGIRVKAIRKTTKTERTTKQNDVMCTVCCKKFANKRTFQAHTHKTKTCEICSRVIGALGYRRHMENHKLGPQVCHMCGAKLQNKSSLDCHLFYSHNDNRYKCEDCGQLFKKKHRMEMHRRKDHLQQPSFFCDTCGKGFYSRRYLKKHIQMTHLKLRPHICDFCNKAFSSPYALKTHRRQHTNETPYRCEVCGEGFRQNVSLKAHKKSKHDIMEVKTCECKVCGKGFASPVALHSHMRLHR